MLRILKNKNKVEELKSPIALIIWTKCPEKWILIDLETGQNYSGTKHKYNNYLDTFTNKINENNLGGWLPID